MTVADRIKEKRLELGITQSELAKRIGAKDKSSISKIESKGNDVTLKDIRRIADALNIDAKYLMGWDEQTYNVGLTAEEKTVIENYRNADDELKRMVNRILAYERGLKNDD